MLQLFPVRALGLFASGLLLTVGLSCQEPVTLPPVEGPPLAIPPGPVQQADDRPLEITLVSPQGQLEQGHSQILVSFSKPMIALEAVEQRAQKAPLRITPEVAGQQRWQGSRTLVFVPEEPLPGSTSFSLEVPAGIRALDGSALAQAKSWSFTTPRLKVSRVVPYSGARRQPPQPKVQLYFNQPVRAAALARQASFVALLPQGQVAVAVRVKRGKNNQHYVVQPAQPLPLAAKVELRISEALKGEAGPLPMGEAYAAAYATYGPLRLVGLPQTSGLDPADGLAVRFTNPVNVRAAKQALRLNGKPVAKPGRGSSYTSDTIYLDVPLRARQRYTLSVVGQLSDRFGQPLQGARTQSFSTGDFSPYASLPAGSGVLEAGGGHQLPLRFRNALSARLLSRPLDQAETAKLLDDPHFWSDQVLLLQERPGTRVTPLQVSGQANRVISRRVDLRQLLGSDRGILALELDAVLPAERGQGLKQVVRQRAVLRLTDLAITAKHSPHGSLIWVTSLSRGEPLAGCQVAIYARGQAQPLWRGVTDQAGLVQAPGVSDLGQSKIASEKLIFFAEKDGDRSYVEASSRHGISPWEFGISEAWDADGQRLMGLLFSDRGVYRPGETVHLKGIARQVSAARLQVPAGRELELIVSDSRGEKLASTQRQLSAYGTFDLELELPAAAPLGSYSVTAKLSDGESFHGGFQVQEYRPASFKVAVKTEAAQLVRGDTLSWTVAGDYLFGAPMRGAKLRWYLSHEPASFSPPEHEGYVFGEEVQWWDDSERAAAGITAEGEGKLDAAGRAQGSQRLQPPQMRGPQRYRLEATVTDLSRQTVASRAHALLHPGTVYLGAKPRETFLKAGELLQTELVAVTPAGQRRAGVPIKGTLLRRTWHSVRKQGFGGAHSYVTRPVDTPVGSCQVRSGPRPARCELKVPQAGYYILRLTGKDERGNPLSSSLSVYATGADYVAWRRDEEARVELVTDREQYELGQVARVLIKSPFAQARGLFTVERDGIYRRQAIQVSRAAQWLEIPITEEMVPEAYVSLTLVRGRSGPPPRAGLSSDQDPNEPVVKVGYAKLAISQRSRRLQVQVRPARESYRPGQQVEVALAVRDHAGRPVQAELTVFAADEGVLSLMGYKTPDPMALFYAERGLAVHTADSRVVLLSQRLFGEKGRNPGGGGAELGAGHSGVRHRFVSTPYFNPAVLTDAAGQAQVRFTLPDNLTTYRIMAVAVGRSDTFGSGQQEIKVNKPLLLQAALPRLLRVGDRAEAGVVLHNRSARGGKAKLQAAAQGLLLEGPTSKEIAIPAGGSAEVRFALRAEAPGQAALRFSAVLGDDRDALEVKLPVQLPLSVESVATFGSTERAAAEAVVPAGDIRPDVGGLELTLSSSALVNLKPAMEYLLDYPFECLEQSTSRLVALALLSDLARAFGLKQADEVKPLIRQLIGQVEEMQRWDGGFSFWPGSYSAAPWSSAFAAWGLAQARAKGYPVSGAVLEKAKGYLLKELTREAERGGGPARTASTLALRTFLAQVLTELGVKVESTLTTLYEQRKQLPAFSKAQLLTALAQSKGGAPMIETLQLELVQRIQQTAQEARVEENLGDGYDVFFHSDTRATALALQALLASAPDHPLVEKLAAHLLAVRQDGRWRNTQESVYALLALERYLRAREQERPDFVAKVVLGQRLLWTERFAGRSLTSQSKTVSMARLLGAQQALGFLKQGPGRLYYGARLRYARQELPRTSWDEGIFVARSYARVDPQVGNLAGLRGELQPPLGQSAGQVQAGDLVRVRLQIVAPQQLSYVALRDPLPAGLEAVNFQLMTETQALREGEGSRFRPEGSRADGRAWYTPFYHREIRDDAVELFADTLPPGIHSYVYLARATTIGSFVAPPARAEQMYAPEVFGRTGAANLQVIAP